MPRTEYAGLRYPGLDDVNPSQAALDLLGQIEQRNSQNSRRVAELRRTRGCSLRFNGSINVTHGFGQYCQYNEIVVDPDRFFNPAVSNTNVNLPAGVWLISASIVISCGVDMTTSGFDLALGGVTYASQTNGLYASNVSNSSLTTICRTTAASTALQIIAVQFNISSIVATLVAGDLQVARIGIL